MNASEDPIILREFSTFREWVRRATERARELGYGMDQFWLLEPGITSRCIGESLRARGIRGLIVAGMQSDGALPASHADLWSSFTSVVIGMRPKAPSLHFTSNDQFLTARQAAAELQQLGYARIGLVIDRRIDAWLEHRFTAGFTSIGPGETQRFKPIFDFRKTDFDRFKKWCLTNRPDALITLHLEVEEWLKASGLKVPRDLGLVHLDREESMTDWAGMDQNNYRIGASATDMVVGALHRNEQGVPSFPRSTMLQSTWVNGATLQPQKKRATKRAAASRK